jgi:hypothetical protein
MAEFLLWPREPLRKIIQTWSRGSRNNSESSTVKTNGRSCRRQHPLGSIVWLSRNRVGVWIVEIPSERHRLKSILQRFKCMTKDLSETIIASGEIVREVRKRTIFFRRLSTTLASMLLIALLEQDLPELMLKWGPHLCQEECPSTNLSVKS